MMSQNQVADNNIVLDLSTELPPLNAVMEPIPNPARNSMTFDAKDVNYNKCRICFDVDCENFENLQAHFELSHPVEQRGDNFYQNNQLVATFNDSVCILKNCTYSKTEKKKLDKMTNKKRLRYRLVQGGDYSGFKGFLPWDDEFEQEKALMLCVANTENVKNYSEDIVSNYIKTYGILATLRPQQFTVPLTGSLLLKKKCPFSSRNRLVVAQSQNVIEKLDDQMEAIAQQSQIVVDIRNHQIEKDRTKQTLAEAQTEISEKDNQIEALKSMLSSFEKEKKFVDDVLAKSYLRVTKNDQGQFHLNNVCSQCDSHFTNIEALNYHCEIDHIVIQPFLEFGNFLCHICANGFSTEILLAEHMLVEHPKEHYLKPMDLNDLPVAKIQEEIAQKIQKKEKTQEVDENFETESKIMQKTEDVYEVLKKSFLEMSNNLQSELKKKRPYDISKKIDEPPRKKSFSKIKWP